MNRTLRFALMFATFFVLLGTGRLSVTPTSNGGLSILGQALFCCNEQPGPNLTPVPADN